MRKIIHVDMDAFYASVEQRDNPALQGRPVIVGGAADQRGVVAAASYEARAFGIHSAMPSSRAQRLCPDAVFLRPRFDVYRSVSHQIRAIFLSVTPCVEPLSLDEAYLDVSGVEAYQGSATRMAVEIKRQIREQTGVTASAGVSYNKLLAKLASDMDKPDGLTVITPGAAPALLREMSVKRLPGVGPATMAKMQRLDIHTCAQLMDYPEAELTQRFGRLGARFKSMAAGIDERPVSPHRAPQSIGAETTFPQDILDVSALHDALAGLAEKVAGRLHSRKLAGRNVTLKIKYADFSLITRSLSLPFAVHDAASLLSHVPALIERTQAGRRAVRLAGITVSRLEPKAQVNRQAGLFEPGES